MTFEVQTVTALNTRTNKLTHILPSCYSYLTYNYANLFFQSYGLDLKSLMMHKNNFSLSVFFLWWVACLSADLAVAKKEQCAAKRPACVNRCLSTIITGFHCLVLQICFHSGKNLIPGNKVSNCLCQNFKPKRSLGNLYCSDSLNSI